MVIIIANSGLLFLPFAEDILFHDEFPIIFFL
jgi:hypothetical protein